MANPFPLTFETRGIWLDGAYLHPMPLEAQRAIRTYLRERTDASSALDTETRQRAVRIAYASLVGARCEEIAFAPGATWCERSVIAALGLRDRGRIVTDDLHFPGSLQSLERLRQNGVDVVVVPSWRGIVEPRQIARALKAARTDLLAISWVSATNGFTHDLPEVARIAHDHGALVYADIIQGAGAIELDLPASRVDFAGTSSYKWLMGDIGLGFLYAAEHAWNRVMPQRVAARGAFGTTERQGSDLDAPTLFPAGSTSNIVVAALDRTLPALLALPGRSTQALRQPLYDHLIEELGRMHIAPLSPGSRGPICVVAVERGVELARQLHQSSIYATYRDGNLRIAPSVFNRHEDIDAICAVMRKHLR